MHGIFTPIHSTQKNLHWAVVPRVKAIKLPAIKPRKTATVPGTWFSSDIAINIIDHLWTKYHLTRFFGTMSFVSDKSGEIDYGYGEKGLTSYMVGKTCNWLEFIHTISTFGKELHAICHSTVTIDLLVPLWTPKWALHWVKLVWKYF